MSVSDKRLLNYTFTTQEWSIFFYIFCLNQFLNVPKGLWEDIFWESCYLAVAFKVEIFSQWLSVRQNNFHKTEQRKNCSHVGSAFYECHSAYILRIYWKWGWKLIIISPDTKSTQNSFTLMISLRKTLGWVNTKICWNQLPLDSLWCTLIQCEHFQSQGVVVECRSKNCDGWLWKLITDGYTWQGAQR